MNVGDEISCDLLIFVSVASEQQQLKRVAQELNVQFERHEHGTLGQYHRLGTVGDFRVNAVRTAMGPLSYGGSASKGILFKEASSATAIVQIGMAFGVDPGTQRIGDVLISSSLIPYDRRDIRPDRSTVWRRWARKYLVDYTQAKTHYPKESLLRVFQQAIDPAKQEYNVHVGAVLSAAARIHSSRFRDELVAQISHGRGKVVGGEMEGVGLLSCSAPDDPCWIVVKGISDFADENRDTIIKESRPTACRNSASFVPSALLSAKRA
jgi:adenosylhomocysteine nucleosidase